MVIRKSRNSLGGWFRCTAYSPGERLCIDSRIAEFAGLEFAGLENDGLENDGVEQEQTYAFKVVRVLYFTVFQYNILPHWSPGLTFFRY